MSEFGETVGEHTRPLMDFDQDAKKSEYFLKNKTLNPNPPLTLKQKLIRIGAAAAVAAGGIFAYKQGHLDSAESEQKGLLGQEQHQTIDTPSEEKK